MIQADQALAEKYFEDGEIRTRDPLSPTLAMVSLKSIDFVRNFWLNEFKKKVLIKLIQGHPKQKGQNIVNKNYMVFTETTHQRKEY